MISRASVVALTVGILACTAEAASDPFGPIPSPHDSRNVSFVYDPGKIFTLLAQAGQFVHVELAPGEKIVTLQMSDPVRWTASRVESASVAPRIFFKPSQVGISTTASIVTNAGRIYELLLQSVPDGSYRYQRVSWTYPDVEAREEAARAAVVESGAQERRRVASLEVSPALSIEDLRWDYEVSGVAPFRPDAVFDDGHFTYLKFSSAAQEWPAVFMLEGKTAVLVDVVRKGPYLVVQRLVDGLLLKLDDREVRVVRRDGKRVFSWSMWR